MSPEMFQMVMAFLSSIENQKPADATWFMPYIQKIQAKNRIADWYNNNDWFNNIV